MTDLRRNKRQRPRQGIVRILLIVLAAVVLLPMAAGRPVTGQDANVILDVPLLRQADPRWQQVSLGIGGPPIGDEGCALTSFAMVASFYGDPTTPAQANEKLGEYAYPLEWVAGEVRYDLHIVRKDSTRFRDSHLHDTTYVLHTIEDCIRDGMPVIVGILQTATGTPHFIVAYGVESADDGTVRIRVHDPSGNSRYEYWDDIPPGWDVMRLVVYEK